MPAQTRCPGPACGATQVAGHGHMKAYRNLRLDSPARGIWRVLQRRPVAVNSYLVEDGDRLLLVDAGLPRPGEMAAAVRAVAASTGKRLGAVLLTHGHDDHTGGLADILAEAPVPVYAHPLEIPFLAGERSYADLPGWWGYARRGWGRGPALPAAVLRPLAEGDQVGPLQARHTPGHTPGHLCFYHAGEAIWIAGDLLMYYARVLTGPLWFSTCDPAAVRRSAARLLEAGEFAAVCPGHGAVLRRREKLYAYLRRNGVLPAGAP